MSFSQAKFQGIGIVALLVAMTTTTLNGEVLFEVGEATAQPGQGEVVVPISIFIDTDDSVQGWSFSLTYNPDFFGSATLEETRASDLSDFFDQQWYEQPGRVGGYVLYNLWSNDPERSINSENGGVVAELRLCVRETATAGDHLIGFDTEGIRRRGQPLLTVATVDGNSVVPVMFPGVITVEGETITGNDCPEDDRSPLPDDPPEPPEPAELEAAFILGDIDGSPGSTVSVPFSIEANSGTRGFSYSIDFDETVLQSVGTRIVWESPSAEPWEFHLFRANNDDNLEGSSGLEEGFLVGAAIFSLTGDPVTLPADEVVHVLDFDLRVSPDAAFGATTLIEFIDGAVPPGGRPIENIATLHGSSVDPERVPVEVTVNGVLQIIQDQTFFRGDSNGDLSVDISDSLHILGALFTGQAQFDCRDASDANDDGDVNVADAVYLLEFLFAGGAALPPPYPDRGHDDTLDELRCPRSLHS